VCFNGRIDEARPASDAEDAAELNALADAIVADTGQTPVALCGFSFGALVCTELYARLRSQGVEVMHAFYAGRAPPVIGGSAEEGVDVSTYVMAPPAVRASEAWESHFLPLLVQDLEADQRYEKRLAVKVKEATGAGSSLLQCPMDVFAGSDDTAFPWESAGGWGEVCGRGDFPRHYYPGGHDFMTRCGEEV